MIRYRYEAQVGGLRVPTFERLLKDLRNDISFRRSGVDYDVITYDGHNAETFKRGGKVIRGYRYAPYTTFFIKGCCDEEYDDDTEIIEYLLDRYELEWLGTATDNDDA